MWLFGVACIQETSCTIGRQCSTKTHTSRCAHTHAHTQTCTHTHKMQSGVALTHAHVHTQRQTHTHTHTHMCTHRDRQTHTHTRTQHKRVTSYFAGIELIATSDIVVYGLNRANATADSDAFLALPSDALGDDYILASLRAAAAAAARDADVTSDVFSQAGVVATQPNTTLRVLFPDLSSQYKRKTFGSGTAVLSEGERSFNVTLDEFQTLQLESATDLTGVNIISDKPVTVISGSTVRVGGAEEGGAGRCDHYSEQLSPTRSWGRSFATVPFSTGETDDVFQVIGKIMLPSNVWSLIAPHTVFTTCALSCYNNWTSKEGMHELVDRAVAVGSMSNKFCDCSCQRQPYRKACPKFEKNCESAQQLGWGHGAQTWPRSDCGHSRWHQCREEAPHRNVPGGNEPEQIKPRGGAIVINESVALTHISGSRGGFPSWSRGTNCACGATFREQTRFFSCPKAGKGKPSRVFCLLTLLFCCSLLLLSCICCHCLSVGSVQCCTTRTDDHCETGETTSLEKSLSKLGVHGHVMLFGDLRLVPEGYQVAQST